MGNIAQTSINDENTKQNMCIIVYHSGIIFFEEYIHVLTYSILAYAYSRILGQSTASLTSLFHQLPNTRNSAAKQSIKSLTVSSNIERIWSQITLHTTDINFNTCPQGSRCNAYTCVHQNIHLPCLNERLFLWCFKRLCQRRIG